MDRRTRASWPLVTMDPDQRHPPRPDGAAAPYRDAECHPHPVPGIPELPAAVLIPFSAHSASPTATTCPPRVNSGPHKEI